MRVCWTHGSAFIDTACASSSLPAAVSREPAQSQVREVIVAQELLQTMGLRSFTPLVIACPGCGRTTSTVFQELASDIQAYVRTQMPA